MLSVMSLSMFLPSLAHIAEDFEAEYWLANLALSGYAVMMAVLQLVVGPLSDRYGRRPVMLVSLAVFAGASFGCLAADTITEFLAFRMVQGVIIAGHAVSLAIVRDTAEARKAASLIGYLTMAWALAPLLAPMAGGWLDEQVGWRGIFWTYVICGTGVFALCWFDLGETNRHRSATFGAQLRAYPELLRSRRFWGYSLCLAFCVAGFYAFLGGAALVATSRFGMSTGASGMAIGSITAGYILGNFLTGRYSERFQLTTMMIAGRVAASGGLAAGLVLLLLGYEHIALFFGACMFFGLGNGLTVPSTNAGAMSVRPGLAGSAAGLAGALGLGGGATSSAVASALLTPENGPVMLLTIMLVASALGLVAALYVRRLDIRDPLPQGD